MSTSKKPNEIQPQPVPSYEEMELKLKNLTNSFQQQAGTIIAQGETINQLTVMLTNANREASALRGQLQYLQQQGQAGEVPPSPAA